MSLKSMQNVSIARTDTSAQNIFCVSFLRNVHYLLCISKLGSGTSVMLTWNDCSKN